MTVALAFHQTTGILEWLKLKAFADDKLNAIEKRKFVLEWVENMEKGENAGFQRDT